MSGDASTSFIGLREKAPIRCQVSPWGVRFEKVGAIGLAFRVQYYFLEIAYPVLFESKAAGLL